MADADQWRVFIADTLTGQIRADVAYTGDPTFDRTISDKGSLTVATYIGGPNAQVDFHTYTRPGMYSWILAYGTSIVQAGPIWSYKFTDDSRTLEVTCGGMFSLFSRRVTRNPQGSANDAVPAIVNESEDLNYTGMSLRGIMRALVADNLAQLDYGMPSIILPEVTETGENERNYMGYDLKMLADNMTDLAGVINGPEFDFAPEFNAAGTYVQWRLKIGSPLLGDQESTNVWDYGTEGSPINTIDVDVDGSNSPITRVWVKGDGTERGLLTGFAEDLTRVQAGYPGTDYVDGDHTSATQQQTLEDYADQDLEILSTATETWTCDVRIAGPGAVEYAPALQNWQLGDAPVFALANHPWLPDGAYRRRVLGYANSSPSSVKLTLAETPETVI